MPEFPQKPTLQDLQQYQKELCSERGWDKATDLETFLLLSEEVGELAKAIRHRKKIFTESGKKIEDNELESELADVFSYLLELSNKFEIDLEESFRRKEAVNATRNWDN